MGAQLRQLRRRIRSVKSTAKITRAQELIATSRIVKAQERVKDSQPFARQLTRAMTALISHHTGIDHPLLQEQPSSTRAAVLVLTSDRGFCGAYNANVIREAESLMALLRESGKEPLPYLAGRKGLTWYRFRGRDIAAEWSGFSDKPGFAEADVIGQRLVDDFLATDAEGGVGEIHVIYTEFKTMLSQEVQVVRLLPLEIEEVDVAEAVPGTAAEQAATTGGGGAREQPPEYEFEPSAEAVLDTLMPRYVKSRVWHMLLQAAASEHAARRRAMKSATDNANDLIDVYTRQANQARQAEITQEISEIVGGANALAEATSGSE